MSEALAGIMSDSFAQASTWLVDLAPVAAVLVALVLVPWIISMVISLVKRARS